MDREVKRQGFEGINFVKNMKPFTGKEEVFFVLFLG